LAEFDGDLSVLGMDPRSQRYELMQQVCFIADVAVLPRWIRVSQLLDYIAAVHPRFDRARADVFLERTTIGRASRVKELSKGMVAQLHLAIVMAIDARLLVLDEPTLGLDIRFRKQFYDTLLEDFQERDRTIILATHDVEEIEHVLTDVIFLDRGRIALRATMDELESRYREVRVHPDHVAQARDLAPIHERDALGQRIMLFDGVAQDRLTALGGVRTPSVADLFLARVGDGAGEPR
jgi:ABC-2 type transport system ATP-binding protein